jgi:hypothetical protein
VFEAAVTLELTASASVGALHEVLGVLVLGADRRPNRDHDGQGQRSRYQEKGTHHRLSAKGPGAVGLRHPVAGSNERNIPPTHTVIGPASTNTLPGGLDRLKSAPASWALTRKSLAYVPASFAIGVPNAGPPHKRSIVNSPQYRTS